MQSIFPEKGTLFVEQGAGSNAARLRGFPNTSSAIVDAAMIDDGDLVNFNPAFGNPVIQTAGSAFVTISIPIRLFIGHNCSGGEGSLRAVQDWFNKMRVSVSRKPVQYSLGDAAYSVYLTRMVVNNADPMHDMISITLGGIADPSIKKAATK